MRDVEKTERVSGEYFETMESVPSRTYYWLALGSILLSAMLFLTGRRHWSIFIGQWAPTLLLFPLFYKLLHPSREHPVEEMRHAAQEAMHVPRQMNK